MINYRVSEDTVATGDTWVVGGMRSIGMRKSEECKMKIIECYVFNDRYFFSHFVIRVS